MKIIQTLVFSLLFSSMAHGATLPDNSGVIGWRYLSRSTEPEVSVLALDVTAADAQTEGLNYLNSLRTNAGLIELNQNSSLETAAQNHADYLIFHNLFRHDEDETAYPQYFTGTNPWDRGEYAGYTPYTAYSENMSAGNTTIVDSIDTLFSAVYHRLGFLTMSQADIGIGSGYSASYPYGSVYNYDMGSQVNTSVTRGLNPKYVVWPYNGFSRAQTSFTNTESPAPLPSCTTYGITGNPVSIEFNPEKNGSISMVSFQIFESDGSEITDTTILTSSSDPAGMLDDNQFVLFTMNSFDVDSRYNVLFQYTEDGTARSISWHFNTTRYEESHYLVSNGGTYDVISGQSYIIQLKPADCTTAFNSSKYSGNVTTYEPLQMDLHRIAVTGDTTFSFGANYEFSFTLHVATSDSATPPSPLPNRFPLPPILYLLLH